MRYSFPSLEGWWCEHATIANSCHPSFNPFGALKMSTAFVHRAKFASTFGQIAQKGSPLFPVSSLAPPFFFPPLVDVLRLPLDADGLLFHGVPWTLLFPSFLFLRQERARFTKERRHGWAPSDNLFPRSELERSQSAFLWSRANGNAVATRPRFFANLRPHYVRDVIC